MDIASDDTGSADIFIQAMWHINHNGITILFGITRIGRIDNKSYIIKIINKNLLI